MLRNSVNTIALIFVAVLIAGCGSSTTPTPVPPTQAAATEPPPTATPAPEPVATSDTWFKTFGGNRNDVCDDVLLADDGSYFLVGTTNLEFEPEMQGDVYLIKTDAAGDVLWERTYEKEGYQGGQAISRTSDGGLLVSGGTSSSSTNGMDVYLMKLDQDGNELWFKTVGGPLDEMAAALQMADGSYILVGNIVDPDDFVADPGAAGYGGFEGRSNVYLAKLDADENELWSHAYGGEKNVLITGGIQTPDGGGLILATITYFPESGDDVWLFKVDGDGNEVWSRTWEEGTIGAHDAVQTADGNYLITGSYSLSGETGSNEDFLFIKIDSEGNELWTSTFGDPDMIDYGMVLAETMDGGYVAAGERTKDHHTWDADISLVKIDGNGQLLWEQIIETGTHCMFGTILQHPDGGYVIAGSVFDSGAFDIFMIKTDAAGNVGGPAVPAQTSDTKPIPSHEMIGVENISRLQSVAVFDLPSFHTQTVVFTPDGRYLIAAEDNGEVVFWEVDTWEEYTRFMTQSGVFMMTMSPDGKTLVTVVGEAGEIKGWDWEGRERFTFSYGARLFCAAFSPDGRYLAVGGENDNIVILDGETGEKVTDLTSDHHYVTNLVFFSAGETLLASYERDANVMKTWDTTTWEETATFSHVAERIDYHDTVFSPAGEYLALASTQNDIKFLDVETWQVEKLFSGHTRGSYQLAFSPAGTLLASAADDNTLRLWEVENGAALKVLRNGHEVGTVAFSPDGALLAFGVWREGVQVWAVSEEG